MATKTRKHETDSWEGIATKTRRHETGGSVRALVVSRLRRTTQIMSSYKRAGLWLAVLTVSAVGAARLSASDPGNGDWPMWGGTPDRNMVSAMDALAAYVVV